MVYIINYLWRPLCKGQCAPYYCNQVRILFFCCDVTPISALCCSGHATGSWCRKALLDIFEIVNTLFILYSYCCFLPKIHNTPCPSEDDVDVYFLKLFLSMTSSNRKLRLDTFVDMKKTWRFIQPFVNWSDNGWSWQDALW